MTAGLDTKLSSPIDTSADVKTLTELGQRGTIKELNNEQENLGRHRVGIGPGLHGFDGRGLRPGLRRPRRGGQEGRPAHGDRPAAYLVRLWRRDRRLQGQI